MFNAETEMKKWAPVLDHTDEAPITDSYKRAVTAKLLENTEMSLKEQNVASSFGSLQETNVNTSSVTAFDPVLISLVRRAMPNLIAYDVAGVQPMSGPTGLAFAMKAKYGNDASITNSPAVAGQPEALFNEADTDFAGAGTHAGALFDSPESGITTGTGIGTLAAETDVTLNDMGFTIDKATVTAKTRQLKAEYSMELAQDLKAVHGLDAESELANILSGEILAEINREVIRSMVITGKRGGVGATEAFDLVADADGRWAVEKFQSLIFQIETEANKIALDTRRGKGNFVICSSNVASALAAAGKLTFGGEGLNVDSTGNTFAGLLNGRLKVYVDPYASTEYATVGYKGDSAYDAGMFYCPYVPLTMVRAVGENSFQPKIAFKTRYGLIANPIIGAVDGIGAANSNPYYRTFRVKNINVGGQT
tara:strand:+ start:1452 stop:2720 length:1269 start_codon:yes stop_codon:yes gene_type:complete